MRKLVNIVFGIFYFITSSAVQTIAFNLPKVDLPSIPYKEIKTKRFSDIKAIDLKNLIAIRENDTAMGIYILQKQW